ncbi:MAG: aspartate aminotransferase family protein [Verrucomicrobia bacterium]|nr:aspartate aminotransferase family protein [Verrucomicrobiota bacterium]
MLPLLKTRIPGPRSRALARQLRRHECRNTTFVSADWPIFWERTRGCNVWDADGNRYLDLTAAFGVASVGHSNPRVTAAARRQLGRLIHAMGDVHPNELKGRLANELSALTFGRWLGQSKIQNPKSKILFANSGSEAVEAALKTAMLATGKPGVIAFAGAYHGLTYGALDATAWNFFRAPFHSQLPGFTVHVPYPQSRTGILPVPSSLTDRRDACPTLESAIRDAFAENNIGAVIVEPVLGRGGVVVPPPGFLPMLRRVCDEHRALLIADEIFTGFCRTGRWFAVEHWSVVPDLICVGKAMSNGFPIAACVGRADVMDAWPESGGEALHTSTHLGNPLGCAMALAAIGEMKRLRLDERARRLQDRLPGRGLGFMKGVELPDAAACQRVVQRLLRRGILALGGGERGNVLTLTPPLTITEKELDFAAQEIAKLTE